jgi:hypothetical protein
VEPALSTAGRSADTVGAGDADAGRLLAMMGKVCSATTPYGLVNVHELPAPWCCETPCT